MSHTILQYCCLTFVTLVISFRVYCQTIIWKKCRNKNSLKGKTVVITGANSGIGKETTRELVRRGARVVMACRDKKAAEDVIREIKSYNYNGDMIYKNIDLSSFASVHRFAKDIIESEPSIDVLINNAAVLGPPFALTADGFETQLQVNHLSTALLTLLLLPKLETDGTDRSGGRSRVIMVTSTLYRKGTVNESDFIVGYASQDNYDKRKAYSNTKLANILFARSLHQRMANQNKPIDVMMASPGIVWTNLGRHLKIRWWQYVLLAPFATLFVRTARQGSQTVIHCATAQEVKADRLYRNCSEQQWEAMASDSSLANKVYDLTLKTFEDYLKANIKM